MSAAARITKVLALFSTVGLLFGASHAAAAAGLQVIPPGDPSGLGFRAEVSNTQAGAHPDGFTGVYAGPAPTLAQWQFRGGPLKDVIVDLPPGLVGNPFSVPPCTASQMRDGEGGISDCPFESQVGTVRLLLNLQELPAPSQAFVMPLYLVKASNDELATLAFKVGGIVVKLRATLRPQDYGIRITTLHALTLLPILGVETTVWGDPADPSHDAQRCMVIDGNGDQSGICDQEPGHSIEGPHPFLAERKPFFTNPTVCDSEKATTVRVNSWYDFPSSELSDPVTAFAPTPTGCDQLEFNPTISAAPTTNVADAPSGLDFNLHVPQNEDPDGFATSHVKDVTVTLPQGLVVNPSSANGLGACSEAQIAIGVDVPNSCPDSSKLGTVAIDTPVLANPVQGEIYLAEQNKNPFNSLIALYIAAKLPNGQEVKMAGRADADPNTGQLTTTFKQNPQLPFDDLHVNLFGGATASLRTPTSCGSFTTNAALTPWAAPDLPTVERSSSFQITQGAGGGNCVSSDEQAPNNPSFQAGTVDPTAGAFTPFILKLARQDGTQPLKGLELNLPPGLTGKLAGIPYCPDASLASAAGKSGRAEQSSSSCPAASQVGEVNVSAGAGPAPLNVKANAYLAGPYKGAPLSMAIITPAVAGPFDLGTVVVRAALQVDPTTAQIKAISDPIPTILQGIPLDLKSVSVNLGKPGFTLNPTSCDPMQVSASALSVFGQSAALSNPFQVGDCAKLAFKPNLALKLAGGTKRNDHPALKSTLTFGKGSGANLKSATIVLPSTEQIDNAHINNPCTRVQFNANQCPKGSILGYARAFSPLLDKPLEGPVYFRSNGGERELPDIVADLNGQIHVIAVGFVDSTKGKLRTTFANVPDAPITKVSVNLNGGKKGLLVNNRNICAQDYRLNLTLEAHNGKLSETTPKLKTSCKGKAKKKKRGKAKKG